MGGPLARMVDGAGYLLRGAGLVARNRGLLAFIALPVAATALAFFAVAAMVFWWHADLAESVWARPASGASQMLWYAWSVVVLLAGLAAALLLFLALQGIIAGPFNEVLSARVERLVTGSAPEPGGLRGFLASLGLALVHESRKLLRRTLLMTVLLAASLVLPVIGAAILAAGGFYVTARFVAFDALDYTMARRLWGYARKRQYLREHSAATWGLGAATALLLLVPVVGLVAMPLAAVGGTLLFVDRSRRESGAAQFDQAVRSERG